MGIIGRAQALFTSNFNALLSRFEEPGRDIAYLLGEMREQLRAAERELVRIMGERKRSEGKLTELDDQIATWEKRAELAVKQGDDGLARDALAQKKRVMAEREGLAVKRAAEQRAALEMKTEIERMRRVHQDYSMRQHTIATQVSQARAGGGATGLGAAPGSNNFEAFEKFERAIDTEEAVTAAEAELDQMLDQTALGTMTRERLDDEFRKLEQQDSEGPADADADASGTSTQPKTRIRIDP